MKLLELRDEIKQSKNKEIKEKKKTDKDKKKGNGVG